MCVCVCVCVCVICETRNVGVMKCMCCEFLREMFVKIASTRTIKTVYVNLEISNIKVINESLINFTERLYFMIVANYIK